MPYLLDPNWILAVETLPVVVWAARPDGRLEFVSRRWEEWTGLPAREILTNGWSDLVHLDDVAEAAAAYAEAIDAQRSLRIDMRIRFGDGSYRWVRIEGDPMRDASSRITRWFGVILDVHGLHASEERYTALAEAMPIMVWIANPSGWIAWYNRRWYDFTGQTRDEALGWGWQTVHHPDDFLEVMQKWPRSIETGEPFEIECRLRRYDGEFHWFRTLVEPLLNENGAPQLWYGTHVDINAEKIALERTKRVAETLQDVFLPKELPQRSDLRLDAVYLPAESDALVGGDWFDAFELPNGRLAFSIGDVAGHGLQASVTVGRLRQAIFTLAFRIDDPATLLDEVNRILRYQDQETIVTALVGFVENDNRTIHYASAGHPTPIVANAAGKIQRPTADENGLPLGVNPSTGTKTQSLSIDAGAIVAFYTDGMTEFSRDTLTVEKKLEAAIALLVGHTEILHPARAIQELVFGDAVANDDAALMVLQFAAVDTARLSDETGPLERIWRFHSSDARTAHTMRGEIGRYLHGMALDPEEAFIGELVLGEMLANTVEHAAGLVEVSIDWMKECPEVVVRDSGPGLNGVSIKEPVHAMEERGRGLFLIQTLAEDVTVETNGAKGTEIRAILPLRRKPRL